MRCPSAPGAWEPKPISFCSNFAPLCGIKNSPEAFPLAISRTVQVRDASRKGHHPMASIAGDPLSGPAPVYTLFDAGAVATATFFGTPVAGGSLMALNYRRLGQAGKAVTTIVLAFAATAVVLLVGWNLPQKATLPIAFLLLLAMRGSAQSLQGSAVKDHVQRGGRLGSKKAALAVGMAFLAVVVAIVFIAVFVPEQIA